MSTPAQPLTLAHWRHTVAALYADVRALSADDPRAAWVAWCAGRNRLFRDHPQTPLSAEQRATFTALPFFPYDPRRRVVAHVDTAVERVTYTVTLPADGALRYTRIARLHATVDGHAVTLGLFWIEGYGGGLFLPFRDGSSGSATYGGGRYLYDTIKGADLGSGVPGDTLILDFNFAYNPSCAYNAQWVCPLAPAENHLTQPMAAGERTFGPA